MLKVSYRNDNGHKGIDMHFQNELLPEVITGIINSLENCNVIFLRIDESHLGKGQENGNEKSSN